MAAPTYVLRPPSPRNPRRTPSSRRSTSSPTQVLEPASVAKPLGPSHPFDSDLLCNIHEAQCSSSMNGEAQRPLERGETLVATSAPRTKIVIPMEPRGGKCYDVDEPSQPFDDVTADTDPVVVAKPSKGTTSLHFVRTATALLGRCTSVSHLTRSTYALPSRCSRLTGLHSASSALSSHTSPPCAPRTFTW